MRKQAKKEENKRDQALIKDRMSRTFADRRAAIVEERTTVTVLKETYPLLFNVTEVINCVFMIVISINIPNFSVAFSSGLLKVPNFSRINFLDILLISGRTHI